MSVMDDHSLFKRSKSQIAIEASSPEFICGLQDVANRMPQLKKTGENFDEWDGHLKVMIGNITGSSNYFLRELHKHDPKFNRAVFSLIFWTIDKELKQDLNVYGSAGDAYQFLADLFQSNRSARCAMSRADFPEEILETIVEMIYHQSKNEKSSIKTRKMERLSHALQKDSNHEANLDCFNPPILDTFQNLAVVNRKFHRLCLPKLWQHIQFPSTLPAPTSIWTEGILLRHGQLVKSIEFQLEDLNLIEDTKLLDFERSIDDNTAPYGSFEDETRKGIGVVNIEKVFKACPYLKSVNITIPDQMGESTLFPPFISRLKGIFAVIPQLEHLQLVDLGYGSLPQELVIDLLKILPSLVSLEIFSSCFDEESSTADSLGWNLAQHQNLRKLRLLSITCDDKTWTLNSWPQRLTNLELYCCDDLRAGMVQKLLNGSAPHLTTLKVTIVDARDNSDVDGQTDLPALKNLILSHKTRNFDLFVSFIGCKEIEMIEYDRPINNDQWNLMKHFLSISTWPKLSVLHLRNINANMEKTVDQRPVKNLTKKHVDEIWNSFKIKLSIS